MTILKIREYFVPAHQNSHGHRQVGRNEASRVRHQPEHRRPSPEIRPRPREGRFTSRGHVRRELQHLQEDVRQVVSCDDW